MPVAYVNLFLAYCSVSQNTMIYVATPRTILTPSATFLAYPSTTIPYIFHLPAKSPNRAVEMYLVPHSVSETRLVKCLQAQYGVSKLLNTNRPSESAVVSRLFESQLHPKTQKAGRSLLCIFEMILSFTFLSLSFCVIPYLPLPPPSL